eukprot:maker-scaffold1494_size38455-snap-gene-0.15 protein:Tk08024 transcript:maker-scaffold1494_size38455-snap-gene-0.15-mRNA-1 annotation:"hypothetical protein DAPPUDRAFT_192569"
MTTSLSRQLERLKTPLTAQNAAQVVHGTAPSLVADVAALDRRQLRVLAWEALHGLAEACPALLTFRVRLFPEDADDEEPRASEDPAGALSDLLLLLSPHVLQAPTQYLLQYLVTVHQLHVLDPEMFLWALLPAYEYRIFHRAVEAIACTVPSARYPHWFESFRTGCHPATRVGLRTHVARDLGFFKLLCDLMSRTYRHRLRYPEADYARSVHFWVTTLSAAWDQGRVGREEQVQHLMPVLVAGLKSQHPEFRAAAATLWAHVLPRIALQAKVADHLVKVLRQASRRQPDFVHLALLLILFKSQAERVNVTNVLVVLLSLDQVARTTLAQPPQPNHYPAKMLSTLILMLKHLSPAGGAPVGPLFELIQYGLSQTRPDVSSGILLIQQLHQWVQRVPPTSATPDWMPTGQAIMSTLKPMFPEEYLRLNNTDPQAGDILFLEGTQHDLPSEAEIKAIRVLLDNPLIVEVRDHFLALQRTDRTPMIKESPKTHASDVKALFASVQPQFIVKQLPAEQLVKVIFNLIRLYSRKPKLLSMMVQFLGSEEFNTDPDVQAVLKGHRIEVDLMLAQFLILPSDDFKIVLETIKGTWFFANSEGLTHSILFSRQCDLSKSVQNFNENVIIKFEKSLDTSEFIALLDQVSQSVVLQNAGFVTLLLLVASYQLTHAKKSALNHTADEVLQLLRICRVNLDSERKECESEPNPSFDRATEAEIVNDAAKRRIIPIKAIDYALESLRDVQISDLVAQKMVFAISAWRKLKHKNIAKEIAEILYSTLEKTAQVEGFLAGLLSKPVDQGWNEDSSTVALVSPSMQDYALRQIKSKCTKDKAIKEKILRSDTQILPHLLAILSGPSFKKRNLVLDIFDSCSTLPDSSALEFLPLLSYIRANRAGFIGDSANIQPLMDRLMKEKKTADTMLRTLLDLTIELEVMEGGAAYLCSLNTKEDIRKVCKYGLRILHLDPKNVEPEDDAMSSEDAVQSRLDATMRGNALVKIFHCFMPKILKHALVKPCWEFLEMSALSTLEVEVNGIKRVLGSLVLDVLSISKITARDLIGALYEKLIEFTIISEHSDILCGAKAVIESLPVTADDLLAKFKDIWGPGLEQQAAISRTSGRGRFSDIYGRDKPLDAVEVDNWKKTLFVLETGSSVFQTSGEKLLKTLFGLLSKVLGQTEDSESAYALDLILSRVHAVLDAKSETDLTKFDPSLVNPELLVQCIRTCTNPGTKSLALLILAKASTFNPEYVLQNSIQIFTFMGTHFLKIDSKQSFDVACQAIDIIIPHIQRVCKAKNNLQETSLTIITTFVDASVDMATHRFKIFLHKLIKCLGERDYLWIVTLLLLKTIGKKRTLIEGHKTKMMKFNHGEKLQQIQSLYSEFSPKIQIESMIRMMVNLKNDNPEVRKILKINEVAAEDELNPTDEYDLVRVKMLNFSNAQLSSKYFVRQVITALEGGETLTQELHLLIQCSIVNLESYEKTTKESKVHKHMVQLSERVLEGSLGLLPSDVFVALFHTLLSNEHDAVRRKTLEVLNAKLQEIDELLLKEESLPSLLKAMSVLATGKVTIKGKSIDESEMNQQLAILGVRSFAKAVGNRHGPSLQEVAELMCKKSFFKSLPNSNVRSSTLLCLSEIFMSIGPLAVAHLTPVVVWILEIMNDVESLQSSPILFNSVILAVQKLMEHFSGFLHPHFRNFIISTCSLSLIQLNQSDQTRHLKSRIRNLQQSMAQGIPTHSLLSICRDCFDDLKGETESVCTLLTILQENVSELNKVKAMAISAPFMDFFLHAFKYRESMYKTLPIEKINQVEESIIEAFLALTLKLSLDDFKPLFYRVFNLSLDAADSNINGTITVFHITLEVAKRLKSLFEFICETLIQKASHVLNHYSGNNFAAMKKVGQERLALQMVLYTLESLQTMFTYNKLESILTKSYEDHVNSLLAFLEFPFESDANLTMFLEGLTSCLAQLALSTEDETHWKYLNYQVLLNLRSSSSKIRFAVLNMITRFVEKKGDDYMGVLPDAVPFLYETMEDEDPEIENASKRLVKRMEEVFGQSVDSYFV